MTVAYFNSGATLGVYIGFPNGVTDTVITWTDVTADVVQDEPLRIQRGRSSERDTFQTGVLSLALLNTARKYDPEHSTGPYFGNLLPGRPIKVELTYSATTVSLFRGFIQGWPQAWERSDNKSIVRIVAHDAFKYLARTKLPQSAYEVEVQADAPAAWWRLGDGDSVMLDSSGNARHGYYVGESTTGDPLLDFTGVSSRTFTELGDGSGQVTSYAIAASTFSIEAWVRVPLGFSAGTLNIPLLGQGTLDATGPYLWFYLDYQLGGRVNVDMVGAGATGSKSLASANGSIGPVEGTTVHVVYTRSSDTHTIYINGVVSTLGLNSAGGGWTGSTSDFGTQMSVGRITRFSTIDLSADVTLSEVAYYTTALSSTRVAAHHTAGRTPGAGQQVDDRITSTLTAAGITWLSTSLATSQTDCRATDYAYASALSYLQSLERTEQGRLFIDGAGVLTLLGRYHDQTSTVAAAFTDVAGGSLPYAEVEYEYDDTRVINDAVVSRINGTAQRASDSTSETEYGTGSATVDGLQNTTDEECLSLAQYLVARYKDPAPRVRSLTVTPRTNPTGLFPAVRDLDIGDKVTFRRLPLGTGSAFTKTLTIEGVSHTIGVDGEWRTTYLTASPDTNQYLIIGDATYGQVGEEKVGY